MVFLDRKLDLRPRVLLVIFPHQAKTIFELTEKHIDMTLIVLIANPYTVSLPFVSRYSNYIQVQK